MVNNKIATFWSFLAAEAMYLITFLFNRGKTFSLDSMESTVVHMMKHHSHRSLFHRCRVEMKAALMTNAKANFNVCLVPIWLVSKTVLCLLKNAKLHKRHLRLLLRRYPRPDRVDDQCLWPMQPSKIYLPVTDPKKKLSWLWLCTVPRHE